ncbi:hypothetical protein BBOV_II001640 [Babesia bovis T2Bo]|uniref:hypothetical protein n=1 Tax=Babesia bovis T2Bo TaxID=484906 RepID=UPI001C36A734|nr:hypothetical protein BBOV_II001640 [Babesia bovis T2Bo]EDO06121.2 hypothetical protein BBOV_II001640 [Babesia bovis T2Bo]
MWITGGILLPVCIISSAVVTGRRTYDIQREISPIAFFGFRKDENPVVGVLRNLVLTEPEVLKCPSELTVRVHKVTIGSPDGSDFTEPTTVSHRCTETLRSKCLDRSTCSVSVYDCDNKADGIPVGTDRILLQYSCELSGNPQPLFDGKHFFEGVFQQFLMVTGNDTSSIGKIGSRALQRSLQRCLSVAHCKYVTCNDAALHSDDFVAMRNVCSFVKPDTFRIPGYAVYPNFTGLCKSPKYIETHDFHELAQNARGMTNGSFVIAYEPTKQFGWNPKRSAWVCTGVPTIVPMRGHVVAIPASGYRKHNALESTPMQH